MSKFSVGEIAIAEACPRRSMPALECEIIEVQINKVYRIKIPDIPSGAPDGLWRVNEFRLSKKPQPKDDEELTTWDHVKDSCGFTPNNIEEKENV